MRDDDRLLDEAAADALRGDITGGDYHQVWRAVMNERAREMAASLSDQVCGHPWVEGRRRWDGGRPTPALICRHCGIKSWTPEPS